MYKLKPRGLVKVNVPHPTKANVKFDLTHKTLQPYLRPYLKDLPQYRPQAVKEKTLYVFVSTNPVVYCGTSVSTIDVAHAQVFLLTLILNRYPHIRNWIPNSHPYTDRSSTSTSGKESSPRAPRSTPVAAPQGACSRVSRLYCLESMLTRRVPVASSGSLQES